jgi:hypothetical protein
LLLTSEAEALTEVQASPRKNKAPSSPCSPPCTKPQLLLLPPSSSCSGIASRSLLTYSEKIRFLKSSRRQKLRIMNSTEEAESVRSNYDRNRSPQWHFLGLLFVYKCKKTVTNLVYIKK